jgi:hypothetical protein
MAALAEPTAVGHAQWPSTSATAERSKPCQRRTNMHKKLAQLVTWLAEIVDRNLIMVPEVDEP